MQGKIRNKSGEWETVELGTGIVIHTKEHRRMNKHNIPVELSKEAIVSPNDGETSVKLTYWKRGGCQLKCYCIKGFELGVAVLEPCEPFTGHWVRKGRSVTYVVPPTGERVRIIVSSRIPTQALEQKEPPPPQRRAEDTPELPETLQTDDWWE